MCHTRITRSPRGRAAGEDAARGLPREGGGRETRVTYVKPYYVSNDIFIITFNSLPFSVFYTFCCKILYI